MDAYSFRYTDLMATKIVTANGTAALSTTSPKFGTASGRFTGANTSYISVPTDADFNWSASNFCVEGFFKMDDVTRAGAVFGGSSDFTWGIFYHASASAKIGFWASSNHTSWDINDGTLEGTKTDWVNGTWYHIAFTWDGTTYRLFVDGVLDSSQASSTGIYGTTGFYGGVWGDLVSGNLLGNLDEIRLSKGVARYTANFTAPSAEFTTDANTVLLLHCNGADASTTFTDDSMTIATKISPLPVFLPN